ncbi:GGDEF domain-containing protein [Rhizobium sp. CSW-27]|uniref:GGDEF domain-containing protein n=1 Tax=Rhizobium sp. CSW-27 TaxID=2839985 RepID=UPI001C027C77|nr:GGDEF domain-containing protein [Rhizobium sp. CSW-27]MBT9369505.1 GGDEF domain-containing protein [Rhizobium sp. CSW-27]
MVETMPNILRSWLETHRQVLDGSRPILRNSAPPEDFGDLDTLIDRSFKAARVGIWECSLPDETLRWTDTVFELFEIEPQSKIRRDDIVALYAPESRLELKAVRDRAIETGEGFSLDARITTARGNLRWIRITAIVDRINGRSVRLFGMKQDITTEKVMFEQIRRMSEVDSLTGLTSRARFEELFREICEQPHQEPHALLLIDLDGFKAVNDRLGHQAGDAFLQLTARRLEDAAPQAVTRARLGGDEFAIIHPWQTREELTALTRQITRALNDRNSLVSHGLTVSASIGVAAIRPAATPEEIFLRADRALYSVKAGGKAAFNLDLRP